MAKLSETGTQPLINMLLLGFSGLGKSSAIVPLAIPEVVKGFPGYELRVLDADRKFSEIALQQLQWRLDSKKITQVQYDAALENIDVCVIQEKTKVVQVKQERKIGVQGQPKAWRELVKQLEAWEKTLTPNCIVVADSLTHITTQAIPNYVLALNNRVNDELKWQDYSACQALVKQFLSIMADLPCHTIITGHQEPYEIYKKTGEKILTPSGKEEEQTELVESLMAAVSVGSKGRISIPALMNHLLVCAASPAGERRIYTQPADGVYTKTPFFSRVKKFYSLETGMAEYFMLNQ